MGFQPPAWALAPPPDAGQRAFLALLADAETSGVGATLRQGAVEERTLHIAGVVYGNAAHLGPLLWSGWAIADVADPALPAVRLPAVRLTETGRGFAP